MTKATRRKPPTGYRECGDCHQRLLLVRDIPPLNWARDPAGDVAVTITDPRQGRFLAAGENAGPLEHRHSVHTCTGTQGGQPGGTA